MTRKLRGKTALVDMDELRKFMATGVTMAKAGERFGISYTSISRLCDDYDIPRPHRAGPPTHQQPEPVTVKPSVTHPPRLAALIATGGRYADLAAWAKAWGVSLVRATQEWHAVRVKVSRHG